MSRECNFYIYCFEIYKEAKNLTGRKLQALFERYNVSKFIYDFFESLHIHGEQFIIADIDEYIAGQVA